MLLNATTISAPERRFRIGELHTTKHGHVKGFGEVAEFRYVVGSPVHWIGFQNIHDAIAHHAYGGQIEPIWKVIISGSVNPFKGDLIDLGEVSTKSVINWSAYGLI